MDELQPASVSVLLGKLFAKVKALEDRIAVLEDRTCNVHNRLEDLEAWQDKVDDIIE